MSVIPLSSHPLGTHLLWGGDTPRTHFDRGSTHHRRPIYRSQNFQGVRGGEVAVAGAEGAGGGREVRFGDTSAELHPIGPGGTGVRVSTLKYPD